MRSQLAARVAEQEKLQDEVLKLKVRNNNSQRHNILMYHFYSVKHKQKHPHSNILNYYHYCTGIYNLCIHIEFSFCILNNTQYLPASEIIFWNKLVFVNYIFVADTWWYHMAALFESPGIEEMCKVITQDISKFEKQLEMNNEVTSSHVCLSAWYSMV